MHSWITDSLLTLIAFVVVFGVIVLLHECGHFIMARYHGVKVLEFGFGMPPRIWGFRRGDTIYSINAIPIGGFVRTFGQNDFGESEIDKNDPTNFHNKSTWQRTQIVLAGVVMNIALAFALLTVGYIIGTHPLLPTTPNFDAYVIEEGVEIQEILEEGAASLSTLAINDRIVQADDTPIPNNTAFTSYTKSHTGKIINLTVLRNEEPVIIPVTLDSTTGQLGVMITNRVQYNKMKLPVHEAIYTAGSDVYHASILTAQGIGDMLKKIVTTFSLSDEISGPIGIVKITYDVVQSGFLRLLQLAALLSITIGVLNVMPFPGLDGGHFLFIILEKIRGKRLNALTEARMHLFGFALLILLFIAVTIQDVQKLITG